MISLNVPTSALTAVIKVGENEMLYKYNTKLHQFAFDIFVSLKIIPLLNFLTVSFMS